MDTPQYGYYFRPDGQQGYRPRIQGGQHQYPTLTGPPPPIIPGLFTPLPPPPHPLAQQQQSQHTRTQYPAQPYPLPPPPPPFAFSNPPPPPAPIQSSNQNNSPPPPIVSVPSFSSTLPLPNASPQQNSGAQVNVANPKPKKPKTATRIAREAARKLRHRERRRIGRRERRNKQNQDGGQDTEGGSASEPKTATESDKNDGTGGEEDAKAKDFGASSGEESMEESEDDYEPGPAIIVDRNAIEDANSRGKNVSAEAAASEKIVKSNNNGNNYNDKNGNWNNNNKNNNNNGQNKNKNISSTNNNNNHTENFSTNNQNHDGQDLQDLLAITSFQQQLGLNNNKNDNYNKSNRDFEEDKDTSGNSIGAAKPPTTPLSRYSHEAVRSESYSPPEALDMAQEPPLRSPRRDERDVFRFGGRDNEPDREHDRSDFTFRRPANVDFRNGTDSYRPNPPREPASFRSHHHDDERAGRMRYDRDSRDNRRDRGYHRDSDRRAGDRGFEHRSKIPLPAHDRPILRLSTREKTPEQFPAMVASVAAANTAATAPADVSVCEAAVEPGEDADDMAMDLETASESEEPIATGDGTEQPPTKRVKSAHETDDGEKEDKATLPETEEKKMDIIDMIRSAKAALSQNRAAVANNDDFISFDDDNVDSKKDKKAFSKPVPTGPAFSHRDFHHNNQRPAPPPPPPPDMPAPLPPPPPGLPPLPSLAPGTQGTISLPLGPPPGLDLQDVYAGKKRTHSELERSEVRPDGIKPEFVGDGTIRSTPWLKLPPHGHERSLHMGVWLHKEILDFYDYIRPQTYEHLVRQNLVERVRKCFKNTFPDSHLYAFGSFASQMYLPRSDMDLVMCSQSFMNGGPANYSVERHLHSVATCIRQSGIAKENSIAKVIKARVPLVKFVDKITGVSVDISFENLGGVVANDTFKQWKEIYPDMPKIALILKQFLAVRGMNEPFSGGLGSFSVICLVVSLLQIMPEASSGNWDSSEKLSLGRLLMEFFLLYGKHFNTSDVGIKVSEPGYFQKNKNPAFYNHKKPWLLSIMDPNNPENDIARASFNVHEIFQAFSSAYDKMEEHMAKIQAMDFSQREGKSLLGCLIGGNYDFIESQRKVMQGAYIRLGLGTEADLKKCIGAFYETHTAAVPLEAPLTSPVATKTGGKGALNKKKRMKGGRGNSSHNPGYKGNNRAGRPYNDQQKRR